MRPPVRRVTLAPATFALRRPIRYRLCLVRGPLPLGHWWFLEPRERVGYKRQILHSSASALAACSGPCPSQRGHGIGLLAGSLDASRFDAAQSADGATALGRQRPRSARFIRFRSTFARCRVPAWTCVACIASARAQVLRRAFAWHLRASLEYFCEACIEPICSSMPAASQATFWRAAVSADWALAYSASLIAHIVLRWAAAMSLGWIELSMIGFVPLPTTLLRVSAAVSNSLVRITELSDRTRRWDFLSPDASGDFSRARWSMRRCFRPCCRVPGSTARS